MATLLKLIALFFSSIFSSWRGREALRDQGRVEQKNKQLEENAELNKKISQRLNDGVSDGSITVRRKLRKRKTNNK